jgi:hypothetical protein
MLSDFEKLTTPQQYVDKEPKPLYSNQWYGTKSRSD